MELWNSRACHSSHTKLETGHRHSAAEKLSLFPPQPQLPVARENSRVTALTSLPISRSHVIASTYWVLILELLLQGNIGK